MNRNMAARPPPCITHPRVAGHPYHRDEAATVTRKEEAREGDRRRKAGWSAY
jgi:hypothetical protein